jgi:hypothetical protein
MEIGLIRLLKNFVPPVFNLLGDVLNVADLPDGLWLDARGIINTQAWPM